MRRWFNRAQWFRPVDGASLVVFRICFGAIMFWEVLRYWPVIQERYIAPKVLFPYEFFEWLRPWPGTGMYWHFALMGVAALGIAVGLFYRMAALIFCLTFTYVFLLDKTHYLNHWYLICLLSFLLIWLSPHRELSVDSRRRPERASRWVPEWNLWLLRVQLVIVYFYAGVAKFNADWFQGEPLRQWLRAETGSVLLQWFAHQEWFIRTVAIGGLVFDLSIGFLLWNRRTRPFAVPLVLTFHLMNAWLFQIGIFPWLMIASTVLFLEPAQVRHWLHQFVPGSRWAAPLRAPAQSASAEDRSRWVPRLVGLYLLLQLTIPLRHWIYPGSVHWTEEGHRFAWHMKLRDKAASFSAVVIDPVTQRLFPVHLPDDLTERQIRKFSTRPDMIWQYARYLRSKFEQQGISNAIVKVEAWAGLNGRPLQRLIDPEVNLADASYPPFGAAPWILPLHESSGLAGPVNKGPN